MATMNISLPDKLKHWVESKVQAGDYASASDCVRDLVRRRMEYDAKLTALKIEIQKGDESGISDRSWEEFVEHMTRRAGEDSARAAHG